MLVNGSASVLVVIVSTSLNEVVVTVPGGLAPGTYTVRLTNSQGTVTGPTTFVVTEPSGGGGCGAVAPGGGTQWELPLLLSLLAVAAFLRQRSERFAGEQARS
jgi:hypothetical protein